MGTKKIICNNCLRELDVGVETLRVEEGVIGTKGNFVPLDKTTFFCGERCLREYYDIGDLPSVPGRIP